MDVFQDVKALKRAQSGHEVGDKSLKQRPRSLHKFQIGDKFAQVVQIGAESSSVDVEHSCNDMDNEKTHRISFPGIVMEICLVLKQLDFVDDS